MIQSFTSSCWKQVVHELRQGLNQVMKNKTLKTGKNIDKIPLKE